MYYRNFVYCDESATFVFSDEESCCGELSQHDGPGWKASISGLSKVCYSACSVAAVTIKDL